eukprot:scaffold30172_cov62-Phaeocystis_antarctica.AAC.3
MSHGPTAVQRRPVLKRRRSRCSSAGSEGIVNSAASFNAKLGCDSMCSSVGSARGSSRNRASGITIRCSDEPLRVSREARSVTCPPCRCTACAARHARQPPSRRSARRDTRPMPKNAKRRQHGASLAVRWYGVLVSALSSDRKHTGPVLNVQPRPTYVPPNCAVSKHAVGVRLSRLLPLLDLGYLIHPVALRLRLRVPLGVVLLRELLQIRQLLCASRVLRNAPRLLAAPVLLDPRLEHSLGLQEELGIGLAQSEDGVLGTTRAFLYEPDRTEEAHSAHGGRKLRRKGAARALQHSERRVLRMRHQVLDDLEERLRGEGEDHCRRGQGAGHGRGWVMDEVWGRFERVAPPCGFCSRMETASSSVGLLLAILGAGAAEGAYTRWLSGTWQTDRHLALCGVGCA